MGEPAPETTVPPPAAAPVPGVNPAAPYSSTKLPVQLVQVKETDAPVDVMELADSPEGIVGQAGTT